MQHLSPCSSLNEYKSSKVLWLFMEGIIIITSSFELVLILPFHLKAKAKKIKFRTLFSFHIVRDLIKENSSFSCISVQEQSSCPLYRLCEAS